MQSLIFHLDMNSYFASVEQQDNPDWRGKPVGVCEHLGGIIIGASREAKKWGITTGTPVWEAKKLYPKIILSPTHPERYRHYTRRFVRVVSDYTDKVEKYSIDEVFLDMTKACNVTAASISKSVDQSRGMLADSLINRSSDFLADPWEEAVRVAQEIKKRFVTEVGDFLTCSIGVAGNKLLAKIGSDLKKPDGIVVVTDGPHKGHPCAAQGCPLWLAKSQLYDRLKLTDIPGIGKRMERRLNQVGIATLKDLRDYPESQLVASFGIMGHHLHGMGKLEGSFKERVRDEREIKSMGHMYTLPQEFRKQEFFTPVLYKLCEMVGRRLRRQELTGNVIHFYFSDKRYEGFGKSIKLGYCLQDGRELFLECMRVLNAHGPRIPAGVTLIGVTVAGLRPHINQLSLFGDVERQGRLMRALDELNDKYGEFTVIRAQMIKSGRVFRDSVGFGRMKELDIYEE